LLSMEEDGIVNFLNIFPFVIRWSYDASWLRIEEPH
jgi:hypothetical protein